ncbi:DUF4421 family protein [Paraflavitalea pollutisoli]|uniref:DUF4421 family protein n=1 Tax=Paraflavitalea pollutisoli TaxID=3034143 RepID=UPI0023EBFDFE|nr:DUF4421 family protein [Paraflavitalea sp. H1-2-19X]
MLLLCTGAVLNAQVGRVDTSYIQRFARPNMVEAGPGVYSMSFTFSRRRERNSNFKLSANSSHYLGAYANYKWLSLQYAFNLPGTQLDRNVKLQYTSIRFRFGGRKLVFHPFYDSYNSLLIPDHKKDMPNGRGMYW